MSDFDDNQSNFYFRIAEESFSPFQVLVLHII